MGRWHGQPALLPWPPDLARGKVLQALDGQLVHGVNLVVVSWVGEGEGQQALLLQVGFWKAEAHQATVGSPRSLAEPNQLESFLS